MRSDQDDLRKQNYLSRLFALAQEQAALLSMTGRGLTMEEANPALLRRLGRGEELRGRPLAEVMLLDEASIALHHIRRCVRQDKEVSYQRTVPTSEGLRELSVRVYPLEGFDGRRWFLWSARDITQQLEARRQARALRQRLQALLDTIDGPAALVDSHGRLVSCNPLWKRQARYRIGSVGDFELGRPLVQGALDAEPWISFAENLSDELDALLRGECEEASVLIPREPQGVCELTILPGTGALVRLRKKRRSRRAAAVHTGAVQMRLPLGSFESISATATT